MSRLFYLRCSTIDQSVESQRNALGVQVATVAGVIGAGIIAYAWWVERQTPSI
jgi:hypothetical protein